MTLFRDLLRRTCTIERPTFTTSSLGETRTTFEVVATDVPCEIQERAVELNRKDVGEFLEGRVRGYFLPDQDIQERDRVTDDAGITYDVKFVDDLRSLATTGAKHHLQVLMIRPDLVEFTTT